MQLVDLGPISFGIVFQTGKMFMIYWEMLCAEKHTVKEGYKNFPSGHTSWSFAGLGFLSLYLSGKVRAFDQRGNVAKLCIVIFPLLVVCLVGISLVDDYWHHWEDVFVGGLTGIVVAILCYLHFFPPPYHPEGIISSFFKVGSVSRAREAVSHSTREMNSVDLDGQDIEAQAENEVVDDNTSRNHIVLELAST